MSLPISVVMPAYNAALNLAAAVDSVLSQTFEKFELIIIDDGSSDNTLYIAKEYSLKDERIVVIPQENRGAAVARNTGISMARGKYIAFLDADDVWDSRKLDLHFNHLEANENLGMSFARVVYMMPDGTPTDRISSAKLTNITPKDFFFENLAVTPSNSVCRKDALIQVGCFDESFQNLGFEDVELFLRIICSDWAIEGLDYPLIFYRLSESGASSNLDNMYNGWYYLVEKMRVFSPDLVEDNYKYAKANMFRYLSRRAIRLGLDGKTALKYSLLSIQTDWTLMVKEPRRSIATFLASLLSTVPIVPKKLPIFR